MTRSNDERPALQRRARSSSWKIMLAVLAVGLGACVSNGTGKEGVSRWAPGKADGLFDILEVGPLEPGTTAIALNGSVPAYRVESYGGTTLRIDLRGADGADAYLVVEGPLPQDGDFTAPGSGAALAEDDDSGGGDDASLEVTLAEPGVYRVIAGTFDSLGAGEAPSGSLSLEASCLEACARPSMTAAELVRTLEAEGQLHTLTSYAGGQLVELVPDPVRREALEAQLTTFVNAAMTSDGPRFPVVPLRQVGAVRAALGLLPLQSAPSPVTAANGRLEDLLGACDAERNRPDAINGALPELRGFGHFPNLSLTACQVAHSERLAWLLASLAADLDSGVEYGGAVHTTPRSLVEALVASGHTVEVRNERTYANFISLSWEDRDVVWPVWLDTGEDVDGAAFAIPMGHSHHAWRITGPAVNARVMFYLGTGGASFFAQTSTRPAWTGEVVTDSATSDDAEGLLHVLAALDAASAYLRRIQTESSTVAAGLPADGYGFLGVCNDSNATIEHVTRGTITAYPLMRAASLDAEAPLGDGLDATVRALPHDGDTTPDRRDALTRILLMTPHEPSSSLYPDAALASQLAAVRAELGAR